MLKRCLIAVLMLVLGVTYAGGNGLDEYFDCYRGFGHGGSLTLTRFQRHSTRKHSVLRVHFSNGGYARLKPRSKWGDAYTLKLSRGTISRDQFNEAKQICLSALAASSHSSRFGGMRSTANFLAGFKVLDRDMHIEKVYCGYTAEAKKAFYEPLVSGSRKIDEWAKRIEWTTTDRDPEIADFVTDVLISQAPKFRVDLSWWWPKERLVQMCGQKNNLRAVPILISLTKQTRAKVFSKTQSVIDRNLHYLMTALDEITGNTVRFDAKGEPRPLQDVVDDYLRRCDLALTK